MTDKKKDKKSLVDQYRESQENAFIREVKAEASKEKYERIWHKYKYFIIAAVLLPLIITITVNMQTTRNLRIAQEEAAIYTEISAIADDAIRIERKMEFAATARSVYRDIAFQAIYSAQLALGQRDAAIITLQRAIRGARDASLRSAAIIKLALEPGFTDVREKNRLLGTIRRNDPLFHIGRLTLALMNMREGNDAAALRILDGIVRDRNAPMDIREQAGAMGEYLRIRSMTR